jgi:hypothetical protein
VPSLRASSWRATTGPRASNPNSTGPGDCLSDAYDRYAFTRSISIPDENPAGITIGPLCIPDDSKIIKGVILSLEISHAFAGDLGIWIHYDKDNDGDYDASSSVEFHLARENACLGEDFWACPIELKGIYFFREDGWEALDDRGDPSLLDSGERMGSPAASSFSVFEDLPRGGSFYLSVTDAGPENTGAIAGWSVYVEKSGYRVRGPLAELSDCAS